MSMRVIAGSAKGRRLKMVPGDTTRPIMDRVKEALFSIIGARIYDAQFLDLFAGTGSVGIEALSRGASGAVLLDLDRQAVKTIVENLTSTGLSDRAIVRRADAFAFLAGAPDRPYDFIYIAPPQYHELWERALTTLDANPRWLANNPSIIVQIDPKEYHPLLLHQLTLTDERKYGKTLLLFYEPIAVAME